jgi:hypothetical protein
MDDFSRQMELFDPQTFNTPVHIIGAGATGSWVALFLAKLGIKDITVWDFDTVGEHNLPNQFFRPIDIGEPKVLALRDTVSSQTGTVLNAKNTRVTGAQRLSGIVFMLTDTMKSRKEIWEQAIKMKPQVQLLIETRMGLSDGRIYTINPTSTDHIKEYENTFYSDEEASVSACGISQSVITTAVTIAGMAVRQLINYHGGVELNNEILLDLQYNQMFTRRF